MSVVVSPLTDGFAAEVGDVDLSQPLADEVLAEIKQAFWQYAVLVFPDQQLTVEQHLAFAACFGPLESTAPRQHPGVQSRVRSEIADVSNLMPDDQIWAPDSPRRRHELGNRLWHTDSSFKRLPALASLLYARAIPQIGGHTQFADLRAAYDALPESMRHKLTGLAAEHCIRYSRARIGFTNYSAEEIESLPPVPQALVRTIPQNGRRTLYLASHAGRILGLPDDEGRALLDKLTAHATRPQFVYQHRWRVGDLVMWDDRCTMHRAREYDRSYPRDMHRTTVGDVAPTVEQAQVA